MKVKRHKHPMQTLTINYGPSRQPKVYTEEEDRFLVCTMAKLEYGAWDKIKAAVRTSEQFRFDWFMKSRTPSELQRRSDTLIRLIERENAEASGKRKGGGRKSKGAGAGAGAGTGAGAGAGASAGKTSAAKKTGAGAKGGSSGTGSNPSKKRKADAEGASSKKTRT